MLLAALLAGCGGGEPAADARGSAAPAASANASAGAEAPVAAARAERPTDTRAPAPGTYTDADVPFSFRVPEGWEVESSTSNASVGRRIVVRRPAAANDAGMQITASERIPAGVQVDLDTELDGVLRGMTGAGARELQAQSRRDVTAGPMRGREQSASVAGANGDPLQVRVALLSDGRRLYSISMATVQASAAANDAAYEQVLTTFQPEPAP